MVRRTSLGLLRRGLHGIRDVVRATLVTYKGGSDPTLLSHRDVEDLRFLVHHQTSSRNLDLDWRNELTGTVRVDGSAIRQAALNLLLNACATSPPNGCVRFHVEVEDGALTITIADQGPGMPVQFSELLNQAARDMPPPQGSTGLGVWTAARLVAQLGGSIRAASRTSGTEIVIRVLVGGKEQFHAVA